MDQKAITIGSIESIYRNRAADFFRLALALTSDTELARDAVQESFARAIRARTGFRGSESLEAWICHCILHATRDFVRPAAGHELREADAICWKPETPYDDVVRAVARLLPAGQRDALFLRCYLGFDYLAIAETLGIGVGTVSATLQTARKTLIQALEEVPR